MDNKYWTKIVSKIIKAELAKRDMGHAELVEKLAILNVPIKIEDLRGRISRGTFSAALFIQCIKAMGIQNLQLDESYFESLTETQKIE